MRRVFAVSAALLIGTSVASASNWVRVETPNVVVYGQSGERTTREFALELERFREALARVLPAARSRSAVPIIAVIFDSHRSFTPYAPTFEGKAVELGGYFRGSDHENIVALASDNRVVALRTIYHEYTHLAIASVLRGVPAWLGEGLADYYSTFELRDDGRRALLGGAVRSHVRVLTTAPLLPLRELLAVTHESPIYNEGERRSVFYAQSWALVHYLSSASPQRAAQLAQYAAVTSAGADPIAAWHDVFGDYNPMPEVAGYVQMARLRGFVYTFRAGIDPGAATVATAAADEIDAVLGNLLTLGGTSLAAEARFQKAIASSDRALRARALLGLTHVINGDAASAIEPLVAAAADTDWLTAYYAAVGLARLADMPDAAVKARAAAAAARALATVLSARPGLPHALALRARVAFAAGGSIGVALRDIQEARRLAPGRDDYALSEAQLLAHDGAFARAREVLAPLLAPLTPRETRELAQRMLTIVTAIEEQATERARLAAEPRPQIPLREATVPDPPAPPPAPTPVYRALRDGEQRTEGTLERVDCDVRGAVTLHVRADGHSLQFTAASIGRIEFISYRPDVSGLIACAARATPERVYITWRPLTPPRRGITGRVLAVEFLAPGLASRQNAWPGHRMTSRLDIARP